ncbi:hypothetical protein BD410DRAFT_800627 [Rickenella mellea]|uniref:Extracellular serine-rich protein n=1 Tax=Rickenella mellea TaxID=50990 RepID=A0A4Y7QGL0_9AGAM|nr:hypothetical protein BD410DRAFT_800627 [Rickenella mellea]
MSSAHWALLALLFANAAAQTIYTVQVGLEGSFYDPAALIAETGDIVVFVFGGLIHGVTQSSFDNPCVPLQGGFNSGLAGIGTNKSAPVPVWQLRITDASHPIYFFCQATRPQSHCAAGMVGAINPPSNTVFQQFQANAKAVNGTPTPSPAVTLTGVGAFATNSPLPTTTIFPPSSSSTSPPSTSSTSATAAPSVAPTPSHSNSAAVIGGSVGGGFAAALICIGLFLLFRSRQHRPRKIAPYNDESGVERSEKPREEYGSPHRSDFKEYAPPIAYQNFPQDPRHRIEYEPSPVALVRVPSIRGSDSERATQSGLLSDSRTAQYQDSRPGPPGVASSVSMPVKQPEINVHEIAKEVATLLRPPQSPQVRPDVAAPRPIRQLPNTPGVFHNITAPTSPGPPQYRS